MTRWILDPGHGGMAFDTYMTAGKQSPEVPPGIYEGEFNRSVCELISWSLDDVEITAPGPINIPLKDRVRFVNQLHKRFKDCVLISIHANAAAGSGWSKARGLVVFHSKKASADSKRLAKLVEGELAFADYTKSRGIKKANHTITTKVKCPAILVECGFMTNKEEAASLASYKTQNLIADAIVSACELYSA